MFAALQLGWIPPVQSRVVALTAVVAAVPPQLLAAVIGLLARDPVAGTGTGLLSGNSAVAGSTTPTREAGVHPQP